MKGENCSGRDAERVIAVYTTPLAARGDEIVFLDHAALWTGHGLAIAPAHFLEDLECLVVVHLEDAAH